MSVQFQPHSQYSVDQARIWRTDRLKGQEEEIEQEPGAPIVQPRFFDSKPISSSPASSSSSSSSSSSASSTVSVPTDTLALILGKLENLTTDIGTIKDDLRDMRRLNNLRSKQLDNMVDMSCPDRFLSMIVCGYSKRVRDKDLTETDKNFLASERVKQVQLDTSSEANNDSCS